MIGSHVQKRALRQHFSTLVNEWLKAIDTYSNTYKGHALYMSGERASVSTLMRVIPQDESHYAVEAFSSAKALQDPPPKNSKNNHRRGRVDLWFMMGKKEYVIEAKQFWPSISYRNRGLVGQLQDQLEAAEKDANDSKGFWSKKDVTLMGILFAVPCLPPSEQNQAHIGERKEAFVKAIKEVKPDFYGYVFPEGLPYKGREGYLYPGVAILGNVIS